MICQNLFIYSYIIIINEKFIKTPSPQKHEDNFFPILFHYHLRTRGFCDAKK